MLILLGVEMALSVRGLARDKMVELGVEISGLDGRIRDRVSTYSKGMARKLLLARALMVRPKLAIFDEPTSGLDVENSLAIHQGRLIAIGTPAELKSRYQAGNLLEEAFIKVGL